MNNQSRRYVFIDFENLKSIKFKKLEKVCDRVFVFIDVDEKYIPFHLVQQMQKLGKGVKWVVVESHLEYDMNYHISFMMGQLHQKVSSDIEFAILSNDELFDPLVDFINSNNRSCIRVKRREMRSERERSTAPKEEIVESPVSVNVETNGVARDATITAFDKGTEVQGSLTLLNETDVEVEAGESIIEKTAEETIRRLIRSGNRPAEISMLKSYILLHNQDIAVHSSIDEILQHMQETKDIRIEEEEVIYNF